MTVTQSPDRGFIPASLAAVAPRYLTNSTQPIRVSFVPFTHPPEGDPDPGKPDYRVIDARALFRYTQVIEDGMAVYLRGVDGTEYVLADGGFFRPDGDLPGWAKDDLDLSGDGPVLGRKAEDGNGYVAIGINSVVLRPV